MGSELLVLGNDLLVIGWLVIVWWLLRKSYAAMGI